MTPIPSPVCSLEALARADDQLKAAPGGNFFQPDHSIRETSMLENPQIQKLMREVAAGILPTKALLDVRSVSADDSEGHEALRITLVLAEEAVDGLTREQLVGLFKEVRECLQREGEERFPMLTFATPADFEADTGED
jgi:hypothetical protein